MKTDDYLTWCLEHAARFPLQHRHGAIIVCGGKVLSQGFDGGALETGRLPIRSPNAVD